MTTATTSAGIVCLAQHDGHAGDIPGDQRDTQRTNDWDPGTKPMPDFALIGVSAVHILQALQDLRADGGGKAGVQGLTQILLIGDQALQDAYAGGQIAQRLDLHAGGGVDRGEEVCRIGEGKLFLRRRIWQSHR